MNKTELYNKHFQRHDNVNEIIRKWRCRKSDSYFSSDINYCWYVDTVLASALYLCYMGTTLLWLQFGGNDSRMNMYLTTGVMIFLYFYFLRQCCLMFCVTTGRPVVKGSFKLLQYAEAFDIITNVCILPLGIAYSISIYYCFFGVESNSKGHCKDIDYQISLLFWHILFMILQFFKEIKIKNIFHT